MLNYCFKSSTHGFSMKGLVSLTFLSQKFQMLSTNTSYATHRMIKRHMGTGNKGIIRLQNNNKMSKPIEKADLPEHLLAPKLGQLESIIAHDFSG